MRKDDAQPVDQGGSRFLLRWIFSKGSSSVNEPAAVPHLTIEVEGRPRWADIHDPSSGRRLFLFGEVTSLGCQCQDRQEQLRRISALAQALPIEELARRLDGSFVLAILADRGQRLTLITDRLGSVPVFSSIRDRTLHLTSSLRMSPGSAIDPVGCATYLRFGYQFGQRTIFAGVRREPRAAVIEWHQGKRSCRTYWRYAFGEIRWHDREEGCRYLAECWREAVAARVPSRGEVAISLSGGMDCRAVLGALLDVVENRNRIRAFSYGEPGDPDVETAARLARLVGIRHERYGFCGDVTLTLLRNGHLNEGLVDFYTHGLDGLFAQRARLAEDGVLLAGDTFQRGIHGFTDVDDVLRRGLELDPEGRVPDYFGLGEWSAEALSEGIRRDIERLQASFPSHADEDELHDYLYLDRRVAHMLMPWRHAHAGRFLPVANPLLDARILDFYRRAPREWRTGKQLHQETLRTHYPELCQVPFPPSGVNNQRVEQSLRVARRRLQALLVKDRPSRLDALIPAVVVEAALDDLARRAPWQGGWGAWMDKGRRRLWRIKVGRRLGRRVESLPAPGLRQVGRLLALRWFLGQ